MANRSPGDWIRVQTFEDIPAAVIVVPWSLIKDFAQQFEQGGPEVVQAMVRTWTHRQYPGAYCVGIQAMMDRAAWGVLCRHPAFPLTPPCVQLPMFYLSQRPQDGEYIIGDEGR